MHVDTLKCMWITVIRWLALIPALIVSFLVAHAIFELALPAIQSHLGYSDDDVAGMSIMDQVGVFGPYDGAIFAFISVLICYLIAPRAKIIVSLIVLALEFL